MYMTCDPPSSSGRSQQLATTTRPSTCRAPHSAKRE